MPDKSQKNTTAAKKRIPDNLSSNIAQLDSVQAEAIATLIKALTLWGATEKDALTLANCVLIRNNRKPMTYPLLMKAAAVK